MICAFNNAPVRETSASRPGPADHSGPRIRAATGVPLWLLISVTVTLSFLLATTVAGGWLSGQVFRLAARETEDALTADIDVLLPYVRDSLGAGDLRALREMTDGAGRSGTVRVTVIRPDGEVVAESEHRLPLASHKERPEVVDALASGSGRSERRSTTTNESYLYLARRVEGEGGRVLGILRVSRPQRLVDVLNRDLIRSFGIAALVGLPIAGLVGWLAARRIARPLETMTATATRMAAGDFSEAPRVQGVREGRRLAEALDVMGRELSDMLRVREESRAELEAILDAMAEGVLALDRDERVLLANRAVADCLGVQDVPQAGTPILEIVRLPEISAQVRHALAGERAAEIDVTLPGALGRVLGVSAAPVSLRDGSSCGAVLVFRDVTIVRRLERTRLDFVANVSHELRTPLAAVLGALETVSDLGEEDPATRARMLDTAMRHGHRLTAIVDDLLILSKVETEGDVLERAPAPLLRAIRSAASAVVGEARARDVTLVLPPDDAGEVSVLGHEGRLEQVWTNLLANAVKYNRPGGAVTVTVAVDAPQHAVEIAVADTGQGIAAEHLPRIFERFYRVDKGRSRDQGGTGLGLAIVKHVALAHRGSIRVESRVGEGTTFRVRLPLGDRARGRPGGT